MDNYTPVETPLGTISPGVVAFFCNNSHCRDYISQEDTGFVSDDRHTNDYL
jgi:hypothetical protein